MTIEQIIAEATKAEVADSLYPALSSLSDRMHRIEQMLSDLTDTVMTTGQVSEMLHCDTQTVLRFIKEEGLAAVKRGRAWYFRRSAVLEFLTSAHGARLAEMLRNRKAS